MKLHNSKEWANIYSDRFDILNADGWDRKNFEESWAEEISQKTFLNRVMVSTLRFKKLGLTVWDHSKDRLTLKESE